MMYKCEACGRKYASMTQDGCCAEARCFGEPLVPDSAGGGEQASSGNVEGLCVLVCDISASMDEPAFPNHPAEKLKIVTGAMQKAVAELQHITKADTAYIAIVAFGEKAGLIQTPDGRPFFMSIAQIIRDFGDGAVDLPTFLYPYFKEDRGQFGRGATDITEGLQVARSIFDCMLSRDLAPLGVTASANLMEHSDIITREGIHISVPNIRVMIYSDGAHGSKTGKALANAFSDLSPSPLMTAFIGDETVNKVGADQMRSLANDCPEHGQKGYFLINTPERHAILRNLFRMASGASGFCPQCLKRDFMGETV